jgi:hypothetical protein
VFVITHMLPRTSESLPILFKSNMSGDLATRTACDTDVHFVEIRSVVRDEELHPGEFSCDSCPENYNLRSSFF